MRKATKSAIVIATLLTVLGLVLFTVALIACGFDFKKLSTVNYTTNEYTLEDSFTDVSIVTDTADVRLLPSNGETGKVVCVEQTGLKHTVSVANNTLSIRLNDTRTWYERINLFGVGSATVTVYLPKSEYGALNVTTHTGDISIPQTFAFARVNISATTGDITCSSSATEEIRLQATTGDIRVSNASASAVTLSVSTGDIHASKVQCTGDMLVNVSTGDTTLNDVTCKNFRSNGDTGDILLRNVVASENFSIVRSTGDVTFADSDAGEITVTTDTGDVKGSLLTSKIFVTDTDTGKVNVPESVTGGKCKITTDTGDISISIK